MAANFMRAAVLRSAQSTVEGAGVLEHVTTFRFDPERRCGPVTLSVLFLLDGVRHEYGFTVQPRRPGAKLTRVTSEWLRTWPKGRQCDVFLRGDAASTAGRGGPLRVSELGFHGGQRLAASLFEQCGEDTLFLSVASRGRHPALTQVVAWFNDNFCTSPTEGAITGALALRDPTFLADLSRLLRAADTGIERVDIDTDERAMGAVQRALVKQPYALEDRDRNQAVRTWTIHRDRDGLEVALDLRDESAGTQRLYALAGPIHDALARGRCLWIDEIDTAMHHGLLRALIKLFQRPESNPRGAQLVFTTHDAAVMDPTLLRRDQIWIIEKDAAQGSQLFSLADIDDKPRKNQPLFKSFLSGRFGGVPRLDEATLLEWARGGR